MGKRMGRDVVFTESVFRVRNFGNGISPRNVRQYYHNDR